MKPTKLDQAKMYFALITDKERLEIMKEFCTFCGSPQKEDDCYCCAMDN